MDAINYTRQAITVQREQVVYLFRMCRIEKWNFVETINNNQIIIKIYEMCRYHHCLKYPRRFDTNSQTHNICKHTNNRKSRKTNEIKYFTHTINSFHSTTEKKIVDLGKNILWAK